MSHDPRIRGWCFTINNFSEEEKKQISELIRSNVVKYGIAEIEHAGDGEGTPHIQGYIYFENAQTFRRIKNLIGERAHIEPAKGNPKQNYDYCSKEGTVFSQKGNPEKGKTCFLEMWNDMNSVSIDEFRTLYPKEWYIHREKVMQVMIDVAMKRVKEYDGLLKEKNIWIYGEPGLGKSRWAASNGTYEEIFKKNFNKWWDGYNLMTTKIVILEDYPCTPQGQVLSQHMKIWGDRYPFEAECKGSHLMVEPGRFFFIVTSNYPIDQCFETEEDKQAIHRRFREIKIKEGDMYNQCMIKMDRSLIQ